MCKVRKKERIGKDKKRGEEKIQILRKKGKKLKCKKYKEGKGLER